MGYTLGRRVRKTKLCYFAGMVSALVLSIINVTILSPATRKEQAQAAPSPVPITTNLTMTIPQVALELTPNDTGGTFAESAPAHFTVTTNGHAGYTLSISAKEDNENSTKLVNGSYVLDSITTATADGTGFGAGDWGYRPSKLNSIDNTDFLPSPTYTGNILDTTSEANSTANSYSIAIAAKVDYTIAAGEYSNTFVLNAAGNPVGYIINYSANSTDSTISNIPATQSDDTTTTSVALSNKTPTRSHYSFTGWCEGTVTSDNGVDSCSGTTYQPSATYYLDLTSLNSTTLKALWRIETHTVELVSTNGTGAATKTVNYGTTTSFTGGGANTGYHYSAGPTCTNSQSATLSGTTVTTGAITNDTVCTVTYAANTYTIAYAGNGNTSGSTSNTSCTYDQNCTIRANGFLKTGYTFNGWKSGGTSYSENQTVSNLTTTNGGTVTMTAQWKANTYTVTLNRNGGSGGTGSVTATYDSAMPSITKPTRSGYTFTGYFTATSGGTKYYNADGSSARSYTTTSGMTLYAQWSLDTYSINYETDWGCFNYVWSCNNGYTKGNDSSTLPAGLKSYSVTSSAITLRVPYRSNYVFLGWQEYTNSNYTTTVGTRKVRMTIPTGTTGNKYYKAVWASPTATPTVDKLYTTSKVTVSKDSSEAGSWLITETAGSSASDGRARLVNNTSVTWGNTSVVELRLWFNVNAARQIWIDPNMIPSDSSKSCKDNTNDCYGNGQVWIDGQELGTTPSLASNAWHTIKIYAPNNNGTANPNHYALYMYHGIGFNLTNLSALKYNIKEVKLYTMSGWNS